MGISKWGVVLSLSALTACGGGGGGSDGGSGGGGGAPVVYSGSTSAAVITTSNSQLTADVVESGKTSEGVPSTEKASTRGALGKLMGRAPSQAINVNETEPCDSGSIQLAGTLADNGLGTLQVTYNDCRIGANIWSGAATWRIDALGDMSPIADATLSFTRLTRRTDGGASADLSGTVRRQLDLVVGQSVGVRFTENVVALESTGRMTRSENLVTVERPLDSAPYTRSISGRLYDSIDGYVDVTTPVLLSFATLTQRFPDSGVIQMTGAGNATLRATALSSSVVRLALDLNGDGASEITATLRWTDLSGPASADLADNDGDGMHNSWETANQLNPNLNDAAGDPDGDGFSNLSEYLGASNPRAGASVPALLISSTVTVASDVTSAANFERPGRGALASDGSGYLQVYCRDFGASEGLFAVSMSEAGDSVSAFRITNENCFEQRPVAAFGGGNYLIARRSGEHIFGIRVTSAGAVLDGAGGFQITVNGGSGHGSPAVAFDGTNFLVAFVRSHGGNLSTIQGVRVTPDGVVLGQFAISTGIDNLDHRPHVAFDGTNYLVVWSRLVSGGTHEDVVGARVSPSGSVLDGTPIAIASLAQRELATGVAFDGANYLVVWDHSASNDPFTLPADGQIFGRRVTPAGTLLDGSATNAGIAISTGTSAFSGNHSSSVAFAGSSFLVTWVRGSHANAPIGGIFAARVSRAGARLDGAPSDLGVRISSTSTAYATRFLQPFVASSGQTALMSWVDNTEMQFDQQKDILAASLSGL